MKLRITADAIRLRLSGAELAALAERGELHEEVRFGGGRCLDYRLRADATVTAIAAHFDGERIEVRVPRERLMAWCASNEVSLAGRQPHEAGELAVFIERDLGG